MEIKLNMENRFIRRNTIAEQVMEKIRNMISSGEFKVGDTLPNESAMAERFGIGRSSLREAVKILDYIGVLNSSAGRATIVCNWENISSEALTWTSLLSEKDFHELMDFRYVIEQRCISRLTENFQASKKEAKDTVEEMENQIFRIRKAAEDKDGEVLVETDFQFHASIIGSSQNSMFSMVYTILRSFMIDVTEKLLCQYQEPLGIFLEHKKILDCIRTGNPQKAANAIYLHNEDTKKRIGMILS